MLEALRAWFYNTLVGLSKKSETAGAIRYALGRWPALVRYLDDGELEIDNNAANAASSIGGVMPRARLCRVRPEGLQCIDRLALPTRHKM